MRKLGRLFHILSVFLRYGVDEIALAYVTPTRFTRFIEKLLFWRDLSASPGVRLRLALEELGPIFIKFGQALSTRRDVLPEDIANELSLLQDRVAPFDPDLAVSQIIESLGKHPDELFASFSRLPTASASVAQVHLATLRNGREVAVKVLRPNMKKRIDQDIGVLYQLAAWSEKYWKDGRRLRLCEVVNEFEKNLHDELDLMREAANCSQLRRNFMDSDLLLVPEVYWDYCSSQVMVMERMRGIPVSHTERLVAEGVDLKKLAENGVTIFLTQVFRDGFFHADMHPGNIFVSIDPATFGCYIAIDFGIMGTLNDYDKGYLTRNFLAFFQRDYRKVAEAHIESGWAPPETRVEELEAAVRTCCEPIFDRPLKEFSFGQVLIRLFQTSRRFNIEVQPQLVLLQKTMLNVEGLGRQLDPDLDLWKTAKPILENWMHEQVGWKGMVERFRTEAVHYGHIFPQLPRLLEKALISVAENNNPEKKLLQQLVSEQQRTNRFLKNMLYFGAGVLAGVILLRVILVWRYLL